MTSVIFNRNIPYTGMLKQRESGNTGTKKGGIYRIEKKIDRK